MKLLAGNTGEEKGKRRNVENKLTGKTSMERERERERGRRNLQKPRKGWKSLSFRYADSHEYDKVDYTARRWDDVDHTARRYNGVDGTERRPDKHL